MSITLDESRTWPARTTTSGAVKTITTCRIEAPDLRGKVIVQSARLVSDQLHIPFPTLDASELWQRYHADTWPTLMVVDREGILRHVQIGEGEDLDSTLTSILEGVIKSP
ncbi:peroxiredoxin family protein [Fontivita pretiosa]|uniref:peroxiredoxin family protein n=1 Tax=Fontivita pretiosa TaxID=2989684 RepID=UPI003D1871BD